MCLLWEGREEGEGEERGCKPGLEVTQGGCPMGQTMQSYSKYIVKKRLAGFPSPAGISLTKLSLAGNNLITPGQGEFGARLGTEEPLTFFYSVSIEDVDSSLKGTDRARTFRLLRSLDSKESIPTAYVAWYGRYGNPIPTWFLAPIDCLKILVLYDNPSPTRFLATIDCLKIPEQDPWDKLHSSVQYLSKRRSYWLLLQNMC
jgi:hypothetical protein